MVYRKEPVSGNRYGWRTDHGYASDADGWGSERNDLP